LLRAASGVAGTVAWFHRRLIPRRQRQSRYRDLVVVHDQFEPVRQQYLHYFIPGSTSVLSGIFAIISNRSISTHAGPPRIQSGSIVYAIRIRSTMEAEWISHSPPRGWFIRMDAIRFRAHLHVRSFKLLLREKRNRNQQDSRQVSGGNRHIKK
jgi:hypothetical protein